MEPKQKNPKSLLGFAPQAKAVPELVEDVF
jgi:hypothetical protein